MTKKKAAPKVSDAERRYEKLLANNERLATNIAAARKTMAKRRRAVLDLANSAAHEPIGSEKGDLARKIIAEVGARVQLEEDTGMPVQWRTDPERAISETLERAASAKFTSGRKVGTTSPIRKRMAELLRKTPGMNNAALWDVIKAQPPRGWELVENHLGKYAYGPTGMSDMGYSRFCNVAAELRRNMKG